MHQGHVTLLMVRCVVVTEQHQGFRPAPCFSQDFDVLGFRDGRSASGCIAKAWWLKYRNPQGYEIIESFVVILGGSGRITVNAFWHKDDHALPCAC